MVVKVLVCHNRRSMSDAADSLRRGRLPGAAGAVVGLAALALVSVQSCYWVRYHDLLRTHVSLMSRMAADAVDQLAAGARPLAPADVERLRYPLQRARHFVDVSRSRRGELQSFREFEAFLELYASLVDDLDRLRVEERRAAAVAHAEADAARLLARGQAAIAACERESA